MLALATFSLWVLVALVIVLGVSLAAFVLLSRQWTLHRQRVALQEWAAELGYSVKTNCATPAPLHEFVHVCDYCLTDANNEIVQFHTGRTPGSKTPNQGSSWNVLIRRIDHVWPGTALRPSSNHTSLIDLYELSSYPSLLPPERFVLFGTDANAAAAIAHSHLPALIPHDVGIVLKGQYLLLDFSARPFDELELDRMVSLAEQVVGNLPVVQTGILPMGARS